MPTYYDEYRNVNGFRNNPVPVKVPEDVKAEAMQKDAKDAERHVANLKAVSKRIAAYELPDDYDEIIEEGKRLEYIVSRIYRERIPSFENMSFKDKGEIYGRECYTEEQLEARIKMLDEGYDAIIDECKLPGRAREEVCRSVKIAREETKRKLYKDIIYYESDDEIEGIPKKGTKGSGGVKCKAALYGAKQYF